MAKDAAGPHSVRHDTPRDNVATLECVLADGSVVEFDPREGAYLRGVLDAGYEVEPVDSTYCRMADAFGYETEHYDLSMSLGEDLAAKLDAVDTDRVAATGASCSQQLDDPDVESIHSMELLEGVLA